MEISDDGSYVHYQLVLWSGKRMNLFSMYEMDISEVIDRMLAQFPPYQNVLLSDVSGVFGVKKRVEKQTVKGV